MCMEDIRVMRGTLVKQTQRAVGGSTVTLLVLPDKYRVSLKLQYNGDGPMYVFFGSPSFDSRASGWVIGATNGEIHLDIQRHGAMVTTGVYAFTGADGGNFEIIEVTLDKE